MVDKSQHATDEVFNSMSHMAAAMISLLGMVLLIVQSGSNAWKIVSFSIYGCSLIFLFVCSTLHHAISSTEEVSCTHTLCIDSSVFAFSNYGHRVTLCSHNCYVCNHVWCNDEQNYDQILCTTKTKQTYIINTTHNDTSGGSKTTNA